MHTENIKIQFVKFASVGVINSLIHFLIFIFFYRLIEFNLIVATILGYGAGTLNSYIMNKKWTFNARKATSTTEIYRFILINVVALIVNAISLYVLSVLCGIVEEIAQLFAILFSLIVNFIGNKFWTFR
jgi:putative flippase GtrA